jgi:hypothetical protein
VVALDRRQDVFAILSLGSKALKALRHWRPNMGTFADAPYL